VEGGPNHSIIREADAPEITCVKREVIERADAAHAEFPG
jgi:hypothetical protein